MSGINNYISDTGLRSDGRRPTEVRRIECKLGIIDTADGSASFEIGNCLVYATVYGPKHSHTKEGRQSYDTGTIICNVETNNFSISEHHNKNRFRRRDRLISEMIKETFDTLILLKLYARSTININIEIIQNGGGIDVACINATCLALIDAGIEMKDYCVACNAGYLGGSHVPCLDLNYFEHSGTKATGASMVSSKDDKKDSVRKNETLNLGSNRIQSSKMLYDKYRNNNNNNNNSNEMIGNDIESDESMKYGYCSGIVTMAIMPQNGKIITMQMQSMMDIENFERLMAACKKGCNAIYDVMKHAVKVHTFKLLQHRGFIKH